MPDDELEKPTALAVIEPPSRSMVVPAVVADLGEAAALRFIDPNSFALLGSSICCRI